MSDLVRISMSLDNSLMQAFDAYVRAERYPTRSEAIKALMRQCLSEQAWEHNQLVAGSVTLVYDHHRQGIVKRLMDVQHDYGAIIVSTQHVHLDHHHCLEIVVVKGKAAQIREMVTIFKSIKGVKQNSLVMTSIGKALV
jgi:CopG family nickel-responsive transcriptional regulator